MQAVLVIYLLCICAVALKFWKERTILEFLPSFGWAFVMVLPFVLQWDFFHEASRGTHAVGIFVIGLALLLFDAVMAYRKPQKSEEKHENRARHVLYILPAMTVGGIFLHLSLVGRLPVLELISGNVDPIELMTLRDDFSREANFHVLLKYAFNWLTPVLAPISIATLVFYKRYVLAFLLFALSVFYAIASLAKAPLMVMVVCLFVMFLGLFYRRFISYLVGAGLICVAIGFFIGFSMFENASDGAEKISDETYQALLKDWDLEDDHPLAKFTVGDHTRVVSNGLILTDDDTPFIENTEHECPTMMCRVKRSYKYLVYRWFLVPSEMGQRWYDYSLYHEASGYSELLPSGRGEDFKHLSQRVGNWALTSRFPKIYPDSVHGYAGLDADAYARAGVWGWLIVVVGLAFIRLGAWFWHNEHPVSMIVYYSMIAALALLVPHASIQALLVAQGLLIPPALIAYIGRRWW